MKTAVIGGGVSGLVAAFELSHRHDVTLFEAGTRLGGHALTLDVELDGRVQPVDVGFIVYNEVTYPLLTDLLARLGVATRASDMSFSVADPTRNLEYCGSGLDTLFAQRRNLLRPSFLRMLIDIVRFNRGASSWLERQPASTLEEVLEKGRFGASFRDYYFLPMAAAVWSSTPAEILTMPAGFFVRFFANHGFLTANGHLEWRTLVGGSRRYVDAVAERLGDGVRLRAPVEAVLPGSTSVSVVLGDGRQEQFDEVVLATHSDQALRLLSDATEEERAVLSAIHYSRNEAVLHTDIGLLPRCRRARASWNYHVSPQPTAGVCVTYDLSRLQGLVTETPLLLTLNAGDRIDPSRIIETLSFEHPRFDIEAVRAQERWAEISGRRGVHFCGAYWRYGFHEDGAYSAMRVVEAIAARSGEVAA